MFKNLFIFVPIALDEEIAREELNAPQEFEEIEFNEEEED